jgi:hypothetical protein
MKDRVAKFETFLKENELKRRRAIQKYQTEVKLKEQKTEELIKLQDELDNVKDLYVFYNFIFLSTKYKKNHCTCMFICHVREIGKDN